jgi:hypothetical protein
VFHKIARMLICLTLAAAALVPSAFAAPRIEVGRAWGPVSGRVSVAAAARRGAQIEIGRAYGPVTGAPARGRIDIGRAYGPVTGAPARARIDIGSAYGPIRVPAPCRRACAKHATSAPRVHR